MVMRFGYEIERKILNHQMFILNRVYEDRTIELLEDNYPYLNRKEKHKLTDKKRGLKIVCLLVDKYDIIEEWRYC